jgi:hypothetical protein
MADVFGGDVVIQGKLVVNGTKPAYARSEFLQDDNAKYKIPHTAWRVWDAMQTVLPNPSANDDLGLYGGTFGTASPTIQTRDVKALGAVTHYARCQFVLPAEYVLGQSVTIRAHAGMKTTVSDGAATIDFEVYRANDEEGIGADLCGTAATSIKSLTLADKDFQLDPATLNPGDTLDIRMAVTITDAATGTAVIGVVGGVTILCDVKG